MADFALTDRGGGEFALAGELTFGTASQALKATAALFSSGVALRFDLTGITRADTAGVALLVEWLRRAANVDGTVRFTGLPEDLRSIIRVIGVEALLTAGANGADL